MPRQECARIVLTGGPGSAKTEFMKKLQREPEFAGFVFFDELARQLLSSSPELRHDRTALHREIYRRQVEREAATGERPFISDRGTIDAFAFHPETIDLIGTSLEAEYTRYTGVVQLGSAAALGGDYYATDEVRNESIEEALEIEAALKKVWSGHPRYTFVAAEIDLEKKYGALKSVIVDYVRG